MVREGLLEEVTFLQSPEIVSQAKQTAWRGVEAGVLEAQRNGSPRLWGSESSGGSRQGPGTSEAHISHPGEALQAAGRGKQQGGSFPRPKVCADGAGSPSGGSSWDCGPALGTCLPLHPSS